MRGKPGHGRVCGAQLPVAREDGRATCENPAGAGTEHVGYGKCKWHFGSTRAHSIAAAKLEVADMVRVLRAGQPMVISPDQALLQEVHRSAGVVAWLEWAIGDQFDKVGDLVELTEEGHRPRAYHNVWLQERGHLAKVAKMALDAGVAERAVKLAEEQGAIIAKLIKSILGDLDLSPEQRAQAPEVVHRHLMEITA